MPDTRLGARFSVRLSLTYRLRLAGGPEPIGEGPPGPRFPDTGRTAFAFWGRLRHDPSAALVSYA